jgi:hypothetical protein
MPVSAGCTVAAPDATHACTLVLKQCVIYAMLAYEQLGSGGAQFTSTVGLVCVCVCVSLCVCVSRSVYVCVCVCVCVCVVFLSRV